MTFAAPWQFAWLLVLPVLYWLSLPPRPNRSEFTAHLAQWQAALVALRRRPRQWSGLRFLLLLATTIAAVLAAAAPKLPGRPGPTRLVVCLDASASMAAATTAGPSAFGQAKQQLRDAFAHLPDNVEVTLLTIGDALLRRHGASARALQDIGAPGGPFDVDLPSLVDATVAADTAVWSLTDGQRQRALPSHGALTTFDTAGANAAILAVHVDDHWPLPELQIDVDCVVFAPAASEVELRARGACTAPASRTLTLQPGAPATASFALRRTAAGGELEFTIVRPGDALALDDRQAVWLPPLPAPRIASWTDGDAGPFAAVAAEALAKEVGGEVVAPNAGSEVGLVLVDGGRAPIVPGKQRALTFGAVLDQQRTPEPWPEPRVSDWDRTGFLTKGLDLSELRVQRAWRNLLPPGEAFLWADDGEGRVPLAVVSGDDRLASVHFAFRLQDSNLPLLAAFPQLLRRAFVRSYGAGVAVRAVTPPAAMGEQDLSQRARAPDRPLPEFATPDQDLSAWCVLAGLMLFALRAFVR